VTYAKSSKITENAKTAEALLCLFCCNLLEA